MRWVDGSEIELKPFTGETLCEKLIAELHSDYDQYLTWADFLQTAAFLMEFDTELTMNGIFTFLENSIGQYAPNIIQAFRRIGDHDDADILEEICRLAAPDSMRRECRGKISRAYTVTSFDDTHEMTEEAENRISELKEQLYLYRDFDIWPLLFRYLDEQIEKQ